uniref:Pentatricopeptide repeat-containing protein n=1 Tax=Kalanchoe fedtschenkoi TaxID=63787 RepID=A0A7N0VN64_KALFE
MKEGFEPGEVTAVSVLSACGHLGVLEQGQWVHDYINHKALRMNVFVGAALMDMHAKTGVVHEAEKVFKCLTVKNVYTWNILIWGYAMNGQGEDALRAMRRMVFKGIHKNAPLTELAAKKLLKIEPNRAENYVLLANLFSSAERWAEVGEVRALMDSRGIKKLPGCSSIEVNYVVYDFVVSGKLETVHTEIYNLLEEMNMRLRVAGYLVDTDVVSYDVEEEEKEVLLFTTVRSLL